ncbi:hypothetical protein [Paracoccus sp. S1E-3]|uniref:hypothetical protein n=1 Tax=Paracoccus sp. S1E-3 TaxID=2756130 RepID=UPI0015EE631D|nr:hypothetical protein [Paracoccus sp. S1E-3]MBA4491961.1 hypothetical protein [Paracoccus sp. S1E-3]
MALSCCFHRHVAQLRHQGATEANAGPAMAVLHLNSDWRNVSGIIAAARALPPGVPLIVMIHGYRFCPFSPTHDPHRHILALDPTLPGPRLRSWPAALGMRGEDGALGIAFGWPARGGLGRVYHRAGVIGRDLGQWIGALAEAAGRPVQVIGHSLGGRVALQAMAGAPAGSVGRIILLAAAELRPAAEAAMDSPAGRGAEVINVTSRENDLFDFAMELVVSRGRHAALGFGLSQPRPNWLDLQIDAPEPRAALAGLGFDIGAETARACHWSPYLRAGLFDFYRVALGQPWALPLRLLRAHLPERQAPRWSRLLQLPGRPAAPHGAQG